MNIYDLTYDDLERFIVDKFRQPNFRSQQLWTGIYINLWNEPDDFSNFPMSLRKELFNFFVFNSIIPVKSQISEDHLTEKILFKLADQETIEAVLMKYDERNTLCISTQSGCAMGCVFCATGNMGFKRNLTSGEIVEQVLFFARRLKKVDQKVSNIVFMGMGEPFHNYEATMGAIDRLSNPSGFGMGARRFTISTAGMVPMIKRFANEDRQVNLAISLHAVDNLKRSQLMPINKKYPIEDLILACKYYLEKTNRRITFEWALIAGENDDQETAMKLADLLSGMLCHVNLIPLNPVEFSQYRGSSKNSAREFQKILQSKGIPSTVRLRRGIDIQAGCGQLATHNDQIAML